MKNYKFVNNLLGWIVFIISATVYLLTMEPTGSFWDCGEFISSAYKLEVGHPPGAPIFMLTANLFTQFASDTGSVAVMVNTMSALFSGLTILFLFWSVTHLTRKIVLPEGETENISLGQLIIIMGSGLVGSLAYTFSDTFWFSAVEGEVYAYSSLMTALVFWLILKWENVAEQPHADKWLILIAYLIGLSIAVHLLNLLCIPAIVLVYYYKKYPDPTLKGSLLALLISFVIIVAILYGLVQGLVKICGWFELLFVNVFGFSYNSGVIFYVLLIFGLMGWGIWETTRASKNEVRIKISFVASIVLLGIPFLGSGYILGIILTAALVFFIYIKKTNPVALNTILLCLLVMTIGYSSYALILIRSSANTPMDQNSPEDIFTLSDYLGREQYGENPLFYGHTFVSEVKRESKNNFCEAVMIDKGPVWSRIIKDNNDSQKDKYIVTNRKTRYSYVEELDMLFPRMYSSDARHIQAYKEWSDYKGRPVTVSNCGEQRKTVMKPTFYENLKFFINYQVNYMYWRYFMWNFSGRQNDIQGQGEISNGNWITGIKFIDELRLGPQDNLPDDIAKNKGHNSYFMLPLLLGILGLVYQGLYSGKRGIQGFWVVFFLFFMTGLAIVIYLNQTPLQVRERDYAYAGSFYAFCIWIGIGVAGLSKILMKYGKLNPVIAGSVATLLCLLIPARMASENWDDHDRSRRYVARDFGFNYLATCEPNAIIFTNGDNDTFPLWYAQEVEGFRTDVRVCNLSYLQTDWYIDQMKRQSYESEPLPISWTKSEYIQGKHDAAYLLDMLENPVDVSLAFGIIKSDDDRLWKAAGLREKMDIIPSHNLFIPIDSALVMQSGLVKPENADWIQERYEINLPESKQALYKHEMMIIEMLNSNKDWKRPIYYALTVGSDQYLNMRNNFRQDGIAYRIVPYNTVENKNQVDTEIMFDNLMNKYRWGNVSDPKIYLDETSMRMCKTFRGLFVNLVDALINEEKNDKAEQALEYCEEVLPSYSVPYDYTALGIASGYHRIGRTERAVEIYDEIAAYSMKNLDWYNRLKPGQFRTIFSSFAYDVQVMQQILSSLYQEDPALAEKYLEKFNVYYSRYVSIMQQQGALPANR